MNTNANDALLAAVKARGRKRTEFSHGILTASCYVETLRDSIGLPACYRFVGTRQTSFEDLLRKAAGTLVYSNPEMVVEVKLAECGGKVSENIELPKNTLVAFRHVLTTSRKDRDGDVLHPEGAAVDPKMLLLWNHVHTLPIGKLVAVVEQNTKRLSLVSAIVDMNELSHDAAVMVDSDMARFSHGFRALEFTEMKAGTGPEDGGGGFDVRKFEIMEESMVSCPANVDADVEEVVLSLVEGNKLTSPLMQEYGRAIRGRRAVAVPGVTIKYTDRVGGFTRELTCDTLADLKAAADAGLIGGKNDENQSGGGGGTGEETRPGDGAPKEADEGGQQEAEAAAGAEVKVEEFRCECIECGHKLTTRDHCADTKCPKCGGKMRRAERPGPGRGSDSEVKVGEGVLEGTKPYPAEHACRLREPGDFQEGSFRRTTRKHDGKEYSIIMGRLEGETTMTEQAFRYDKETWDTNEARSHCKDHDGHFEAAAKGEPSTSLEPEKAGRALSKVNESKIKNARESVDEVAGMEGVSRPAKALLREASRDLAAVLAALGTEGEAGWTVEQAYGKFLAESTAAQKGRMLRALETMKLSEGRKQQAKHYRALSARR